MPDYAILKQVSLSTSHMPTGKTQHRQGGRQLLPTPAQLQIVRSAGEPGFYLLHLDKSGKEQTDTYHETIDGALSQAEWEFSIKPNEWENVSSNENS